MSKYCAKCGTKMDDDVKFCPSCGNNTQGSANSNSDGANSNSQPTQGGSNGFAIAGFVLSFFFGILGLVFSLIGLSKAKEKNGAGKGLAVAGTVLSSIHLAWSILVLFGIVQLNLAYFL